MCISPVKENKHGKTYIRPCGYCFECVRKRKLEWEIRLASCRSNWSNCAFFTLLTYDEEHYPLEVTKDLCNEHIQLFIKRIRSRLSYDMPSVRLKYFIASEMGELNNRLHYHCCFFLKGVNLAWPQWSKLIKDEWPHGYIGNSYPLTSKNITYCCKYIQKQCNYKWYSRFKVGEVKPELEKELHCDFSVHEPERLPSIAYRGKRVAVPSYWLKKLYHPNELLALKNSMRIFREEKAIIDLAAMENESRLKYFKQGLEEQKAGAEWKTFKPNHINNKDIKKNEHF